MHAFIKTFFIIPGLLMIGLLPVASFGGEALKFKHITSIYTEYTDDQNLALKQPEGVACSDKPFIVVADTGNNRLLRYIFKNQTIGPVTKEIELPQLLYPIRVQINSNNEIFALDGKQRRIVRLTPEGTFKSFLNLRGASSPTPLVPRSFDIDRDDNMYVLDVRSERVLVFDPEGKYKKQIKFPTDYEFFSDVTVDFRGTVLLIDSINARLFSATRGSTTFSPLSKSLKQYVRFPTNMTTDKRGRIYLVDRNGSKVIILGQEGSLIGRMSGMGWKEARLNYPSQLCINNKEEIFIADTLNNRVQIFSRIE